MRRGLLRSVAALLVLIALTWVVGRCLLPWLESRDTVVAGSEDQAAVEVTMLDVGQGLSVLIRQGDHAMLYDGGGRSASSYVVSYLRQRKLDHLDYIFVSHYDEDHISGLVGVLKTTAVDRVVSPDYVADSKIYGSLMDAVQENGAPNEHPHPGMVYPLGAAEVQVLGPRTYDSPTENNRSLVIRVAYDSFSCILTGDAETEAEQALLDSGQTLRSDLYVVGHHGSASSSTPEFVRAVSPSWAFLSVGADNAYGHPAQRTMETLAAQHVTVFRTDTQGAVSAYSDGQRCWFSREPSDTGTVRTIAPAPEEPDYFILNTNTKKIHLPDCENAARIAEKNRTLSRESLETLLERGYTTCGSCLGGVKED